MPTLTRRQYVSRPEETAGLLSKAPESRGEFAAQPDRSQTWLELETAWWAQLGSNQRPTD